MYGNDQQYESLAMWTKPTLGTQTEISYKQFFCIGAAKHLEATV
jgi:hypothetical protein